MNKRGVELSVNVIIIAIIALLVLVILVAIFTGRIAIFSGESAKCESQGGKCSFVCGQGDAAGYGKEFAGAKCFDSSGKPDQSKKCCVLGG
ncbi:MAG TPA: hypothetical protein VI894_01020 [Candidatus Nanoarchaeia archaeon]|nr:hypothetical protein [Candidatus Nanoarchaeia archaeon]